MDDCEFDLEVRLLDGVHALQAGRELQLGTPAVRSLFAFLALSAGTTVTKADIIGALWGDTAPRSAVGSVYTYVSSLRKALPPGPDTVHSSPLLTSTRAGYRLRVTADAVDARRFEGLAGLARRHAGTGDLAGALPHCDGALAQWTGSALGGAVGPFAEGERSRLGLLRLDLRELRCEALIHTAATTEAIADLTVLTAAHPLRERLRELLMLALYRDGRQAEALDVYRDARTRLVETLGVEPGRGLRSMHERVLTGTLHIPIRSRSATTTVMGPAAPLPPGPPAPSPALAPTGLAQALIMPPTVAPAGARPGTVRAKRPAEAPDAEPGSCPADPSAIPPTTAPAPPSVRPLTPAAVIPAPRSGECPASPLADAPASPSAEAPASLPAVPPALPSAEAPASPPAVPPASPSAEAPASPSAEAPGAAPATVLHHGIRATATPTAGSELPATGSATGPGTAPAPRFAAPGAPGAAGEAPASTRPSTGHLTDTPEAAPAPTSPQPSEWRVRPAQLPRALPDFTGREGALLRLLELSGTGAPDEADACAVISSIDGAAGVGKTALAIHAAHRLAPAFADGQLYLDLCGFDPSRSPVTPQDALARLLWGLGARGEVLKADLEVQAATYRSLLAGRRVLILLDNAADADQVRPLLPATPGCLVLVTSRHKLPGLVAREGARRVSLGLLEPAESERLLRRVLGDARVDTDPGAARALAGYCGHLPLALRIAAERIVCADHGAIADVVAELRVARDRLDALTAPDDESPAVRAVFAASYRVLSPEQAHVFRLLGLHPGAEITVPEAAALLEMPTTRARIHLDALVRRHLLEHVARDRYRPHDLLRLYAAERAREDEPRQVAVAAVERIMRWYLASVAAVREALTPGLGPRCRLLAAPEPDLPDLAPVAPASYDEAIEWAHRELPSLTRALNTATTHGLDTLAAALACAMGALCHGTSRWREWLRVTEIGRRAAERAGDLLSLGRLYNDRGVAHHFLGRTVEAVDCHRSAVALLIDLQDTDTEDDRSVAAGITVAYAMMGRHLGSLDLLHKALDITRGKGLHLAEVTVLECLGAVLSGLGLHGEAITHGRRCVELNRAAGFDHMLPHSLSQVATSCLNAGRVEEAIDHFEEALRIWRRLGDSWGERRGVLGLAHARSLRHAAARRADGPSAAARPAPDNDDAQAPETFRSDAYWACT
ncbi:BTAD domain-containing putative transcriptional regulator [Streptomyces sp. NPDC056716]|uniref:AfsR/SARP family transcriptional regulator n=1 Tax=unclassified Streptomyces TaxID=2593676 RepID=UPI00367AEB3C